MQIAGFQPNSFIDFKGRIAALVFTPYCNMRCWYCHNKSILDNPELLSEDEILKKIERDKFLLDGVVITGGEPTLQADLLDFIKKIKAMGLDVKVDTNGKRPDVIRELIELKIIDYIAMDVKAPLNKYFKVTPTTLESEEILRESINLIINSGIDHEFRMTVIPQLTLEDIEEAAKEVKGAKAFYLQQYRDTAGFAPHSHEFFQKAKDICDKIVPTFIRGIR